MDSSTRSPLTSSPKTVPSSRSIPIRRRRFVFFTCLIIAFVYFFGVPFKLPESLKDTGYSTISRANIAQLVKFQSAPKVDEIYGLLHLVTGDAEHEHILPSFDPSKPVDMSVYAAQQPLDWSQETMNLNEKYPVIVFSKSYCPFSKRAKLLLEQYDLTPPPKIVEVDLRDDDVQIKQILTRLTKQGTFPNIFVHGKSLGGSDDLHALHADGSLRTILESAGVTVGADAINQR